MNVISPPVSGLPDRFWINKTGHWRMDMG